MPLEQRVVEPVNVSRSTLPLPSGDIKPLVKSIAAATGQGAAASAAAAANIRIANELETVTNGTLANLIRQLSSLSRHAEELLTRIFDESSKMLSRSAMLQQRVTNLTLKLESFEQSPDAPINLRDPTSQVEFYKYNVICDQQILSKQKMPASIQELYNTCDEPPPLNKLDVYRDDGKDGLKFYTDPTYFFELWRKDMMKETPKAQPAINNATQQKRTSHNIQQYQSTNNILSNNILTVSKAIQQTTISDNSAQIYQKQAIYQQQQQILQQQQHQQQQLLQQQQQQQQQQYQKHQASLQQHLQHQQANLQAHSSQPTPIQEYAQTIYDTSRSHVLVSQEASLPPPPPPLSPLPPPISQPPPSPPPLPSKVNAPAISKSILPTAAQLKQKQQQLKKVQPNQNDPRADLLAAIKKGITLRKVEDSKKKEAEKQTMGNDVASILARRVAMQASDSEDSVGIEDDEDNDWEDQSLK